MIKKIEQILAPVVQAMGYEWVGMELLQRGRAQTLRVYIDQPDGITLDDCTAVSNQISGVLDVADPLTGNYTLEVSSPGLDRPLFKPQDFERFAGQQAKLKLHASQQGQRNFIGKIVGITNDTILLEVDQQTIKLPFGQIAKAKLIPAI